MSVLLLLLMLVGIYRLMLGGRSRARYTRSWTRGPSGWVEQLVPAFNSRRAATRIGSVTGDNMALLLATATTVTAAFDGATRLAAIPGISPSTGHAIGAVVVLIIVLSALNARLASFVAGVIGLGAAFVGTLADHGPSAAVVLVGTLMVAFVLLMLCRGLFGRG